MAAACSWLVHCTRPYWETGIYIRVVIDVGQADDAEGSWSHAIAHGTDCTAVEDDDLVVDVYHLLLRHEVFDANLDVTLQSASSCRAVGFSLVLASFPSPLRIRNESRAIVEWGTPDVGADFVQHVGRWLQYQGVDPSQSLLLHYRTGRLASTVGTCRPACHTCPREAWWSLYWSRLVDEAQRRHLQWCGGEHTVRLWCKRPSSGACGPFFGRRQQTDGVLMLGGDAHQHRQNIVFGVWNSSLRPALTWSLSLAPECLTGERSPGWDTFCAKLPKKVDVALLGENETSHKDVSFPDPYLYESTDVSIVFETMSDYDDYSAFLTEKLLKPVFGAHPFVLACGAAGALAAFRSLGFVTFEPHIDESYDELWPEDSSRQTCFQSLRIDDLIASVKAILASRHDMRRAKARARYNRRHLLCADGLHARMQAQATSILEFIAPRDIVT